MLVIRLQRVGKKNQASFRVVLQEKERSPKGKAKELLGFYNPETKEKAFQKERITYWMTKGAQPSPTVHNMFVDEGLITGSKVKAWQPKKKEKPAETKAEAPEGNKEDQAKDESPAEPAAESPVAEEPAKEAQPKEQGKEEPAKEEPKPEVEAEVETKEEAATEAEPKE